MDKKTIQSVFIGIALMLGLGIWFFNNQKMLKREKGEALETANLEQSEKESTKKIEYTPLSKFHPEIITDTTTQTSSGVSDPNNKKEHSSENSGAIEQSNTPNKTNIGNMLDVNPNIMTLDEEKVFEMEKMYDESAERLVNKVKEICDRNQDPDKCFNQYEQVKDEYEQKKMDVFAEYYEKVLKESKDGPPKIEGSQEIDEKLKKIAQEGQEKIIKVLGKDNAPLYKEALEEENRVLRESHDKDVGIVYHTL